MKDIVTKDLALSILNGDFDNVQIGDLTAEQRENIISALRFSGERVGLEIIVDEGKKDKKL